MDHKDDFAGCLIDVGDNVLDQGTNQALALNAATLGSTANATALQGIFVMQV